jgi:hypothetical protein
VTYEGTVWNPGTTKKAPWAELREAEQKRRDAISDVIFCICLVLAGILVGWRLNYLVNEYPGDRVQNPHCTEDEWVEPETFECVHIDTILEENR